MSYTTDLYFECHITIEPVFDERLTEFKAIARTHKFRVAELLMQKRSADTPERSKFDTFCTGRHIDFSVLEDRAEKLIIEARAAGFDIWRYKIENTLVDQKFKTFDSPVLEEALEFGAK